jgi:hypothetical protein
LDYLVRALRLRRREGGSSASTMLMRMSRRFLDALRLSTTLIVGCYAGQNLRQIFLGHCRYCL